MYKTEESRTQNFYKPGRNLKPGAGLGSARREPPSSAVFARAAPLPAPPALAHWRRPQERVKKAEQNFVPVLPEPYVMHSSTTITPRSVWELKTLHTSTNDRTSFIPQANKQQQASQQQAPYCPHWRCECRQHVNRRYNNVTYVCP
jgi:hypothetical protein